MASELKVDTIKHTNNTSAITLDTSGNVNFPSTTIGGFQSMQVFTSSTTWTKPSGIRSVKVYVTGGGGGGGGGNADFNTASAGGAGATAIKYIDVTSVANVSVTVGTGGGGASTYSNPGGSGTVSSFGTYCTAEGGMGGHRWDQNTSYGLGGNASGGDINISGGDGGQSHPHDATDDGQDGHGGASFWGGGGQGAQWYSNTKPAQDARAYGAGGGAGQHTSATSQPGADGKSGIVVVEEYI